MKTSELIRELELQRLASGQTVPMRSTCRIIAKRDVSDDGLLVMGVVLIPDRPDLGGNTATPTSSRKLHTASWKIRGRLVSKGNR